MKSLQEALENQLKETTEKAEKQQATVSLLLFCVLCFRDRTLLTVFPSKSLWGKHTCNK